jgi:hypothetical protein
MLLMFVHPECPCSEASLGELERLMARCQGKLRATVVFLETDALSGKPKPEGVRMAERMPDTTVLTDVGGREARLFHAGTSGQTLLYDTDGTLRFQGGITIARGHHGDSPGSDAILALVGGASNAPANALVFGCSLFDADRQPGDLR